MEERSRKIKILTEIECGNIECLTCHGLSYNSGGDYNKDTVDCDVYIEEVGDKLNRLPQCLKDEEAANEALGALQLREIRAGRVSWSEGFDGEQ